MTTYRLFRHHDDPDYEALNRARAMEVRPATPDGLKPKDLHHHVHARLEHLEQIGKCGHPEIRAV